MNKKGFVSPISVIVSYIVMTIVWFLVLANVVNTWAQKSIATGNLTGIESFFMANINLFFFIISILAMLAGVYITSE